MIEITKFEVDQAMDAQGDFFLLMVQLYERRFISDKDLARLKEVLILDRNLLLQNISDPIFGHDAKKRIDEIERIGLLHDEMPFAPTGSN